MFILLFVKILYNFYCCSFKFSYIFTAFQAKPNQSTFNSRHFIFYSDYRFLAIFDFLILRQFIAFDSFQRFKPSIHGLGGNKKFQAIGTF